MIYWQLISVFVVSFTSCQIVMRLAAIASGEANFEEAAKQCYAGAFILSFAVVSLVASFIV